MHRQVHHKAGRLRIRGEMTVYTAAALMAQLVSALGRHRRARLLDLSEVTEIDTAGLQLLLCTRRAEGHLGRQLALVNPSAAVRSVLELCQLSDAIDPAAESVA